MFAHPFTLILAGATRSGKTQWLLRFIRHRREMIEPSPQKVLYCYSELNDVVLQLKQQPGIETYQGLPDAEKIKTEGPRLLLVLDDLMLNASRDFIDLLFTRGAHHWGTSVVFVTQSIFGRDIRTARQNTHFLVLMRSAQAELQARTIGAQLFPGRSAYFMEAFLDATRQPYSYLCINMHPNAPDYLRLSTEVFPGERQKIYLPMEQQQQ